MEEPPPRASLLAPDHTSWHGAAAYSSAVAAALTRAYWWLAHLRTDQDAHWRAYVAIAPVRRRPMCLEQRMRVEFALAQIYAYEESYALAATSAEAATEIAVLLQDQSAELELRRVSGGLAEVRLCLLEAGSHYEHGLKLLSSLREDDRLARSEVADHELALLIRSAAVAFETARYEDALTHLEYAHELQTLQMPGAEKQAAYIQWLGAQVMRWHGEYDDALALAQNAAATLLDADSSMMSSRIQTIVAEIAMDQADALVSGDASWARTSFGERAMPYARRALHLARSAEDPIGVGLAELALVRIERFLNMTKNRVPKIEAVIRRAEKTRDAALHGKALSALADEFAHLGDFESARWRYRQAWRLLEEYDYKAMAAAPRRRFYELSEFTVPRAP